MQQTNGEDLLLNAIYCLTLYTLKNRKGNKIINIQDKEFSIEDAFKEAFSRKQRLYPAPRLIPSPS